MGKKTLGQIARDASDDFEDFCEEADFLRMNELSWEAAANAVLDEAARQLVGFAEMEDMARAERADCFGVSVSPKTLARREAAEFIRSLKSR